MIYKRGKTYHYDFGVNGERYRGSLETPDHRAAKDKEKDLVRLAKEGKLATKAIPHARLPFNDAVEKYLDERAVTFSRGRQEYISRDTVRQERAYFKALSEKLGAKKLKQIRATARQASKHLQA